MPRRRAFSSIAWPERDVRQAQPRGARARSSRRRARGPAAAGHDLAELGVQRLARQHARVHVRAQRAEPARRGTGPSRRRRPCRRCRQRELDGAHRPVGHDERAAADPLGAQQRLGLLEPRRLDDDVGAAHARLPVVGHDDRRAEVGGAAARRTRRGSRAGASARGSPRARRAGRAAARSSRPCRARRCARAPRVGPRQVPGADRRHGAGAHVGEAGGVDAPPRGAPVRGRTGRAGHLARAGRACSCRRSRRRP